MLLPQLAPAAAVGDGDVACGNDAAAAADDDVVVGDDDAEMFDAKLGAVGGG